MSDLNDYINIASRFAKIDRDSTPSVDRSEQVNIALDFARRQAEKQSTDSKPIPTLGVMPVPN